MKHGYSVERIFLLPLAGLAATLPLGCGAAVDAPPADRGAPTREDGSEPAQSGASADSRASAAVSGTLTDARDGKTYRTVQLGNQTWMAENLNYGTAIPGLGSKLNPCPDFTNDVVEKFCYDDHESSCTTYGALYCWQEAIQAKWEDVLAGTSQGICPAGWHLPTTIEVDEVIRLFPSPAALRENGISGFDAKPAGYRYKGGRFNGLNDPNAPAMNDPTEPGRTDFWTSTKSGGPGFPGGCGAKSLSISTTGVSVGGAKQMWGFSVRCVKDDPNGAYHAAPNQHIPSPNETCGY